MSKFFDSVELYGAIGIRNTALTQFLLKKKFFAMAHTALTPFLLTKKGGGGGGVPDP